MASKQIGKVGPDLQEEKSVSFRRKEDGFFEKIELIAVRDLKIGKIIRSSKIVAEEDYELISDSSEDFDETMSYEDIDGKTVTLKFKRLENTDNEK